MEFEGRHETEDVDMSSTVTPRRTRILGALATLAVALCATAPAQAATATSAACVTHFTATFTPGLSPTPGPGTVSTNGETGSFSCIGRIGGDRVTGPGTIGVETSYTGDCLSHRGTGTVRIIIPTTGGTKDMTGTLTVRRTGLVVRPAVQFDGMRYRGIGVVLPAEGDCFLTPLRRGQLLLIGVLLGA
jgi:hypothetical protein